MEVLNLNISSQQLETNAGSSFKELYGERDLSDVTLVCSDGHQIKAHKVILGSSSPVFKNIFKTNNCSSIYLHGVNFDHMESIVKFIYLGQTKINQSSIDDFLIVARDLKVKGLAQVTNKNGDYRSDLIDNSSIEHLENSQEKSNFLLDKHKELYQELALEEPNKEAAIVKMPPIQEYLENKTDTKKFKLDLTLEKIPNKSFAIKDYYDLSGRDFNDLQPEENGKISCTDCSYVSNGKTEVAIRPSRE